MYLLKFKKIIFTICISVFILIGFLYITNDNKNDRILTSGQIAFGVYNNNKIIDSGSYIENKELKHRFELAHNLSLPRKYLILVLIDYKQSKFMVKDSICKGYEVELAEKDSLSVDIKIDIPDHAKELCYLVIKKPNYLQKDSDIHKSHILQEFMTLRYNLSTTEKIFTTESNIKIISEGPVTNIYLSDNNANLKPVITSNEFNEKKLLVGNHTNDLITYAVIGFLDWNQIAFADGDFIKFFEVPPNKKISYKVSIPQTNTDSVLQYMAFPFPYAVSRDNFFSTLGFGTYRMTITDS
ncbi:hypothetical protein PV797_05620 [Clostridiaceae bacterium M8S5]|nr:hypothetical protein PV797_05620 [Clostridiaceae bacterium M8S5]